MDARGVGHVLIDHLDHAERRHVRRSGRACRRRRAASASRAAAASSRIVPPAKRAGIVAAEHQVGIGHRGLRAAAAVAGRARDRRRRFPARPRCGPCCRHAAIEPPPAPISTISITGIRSGRPEPLLEAADAGDLEGCARSAAGSRRSGRSWRSCRPCRRTARWRCRIAARHGREDRAARRAAFHQADREARTPSRSWSARRPTASGTAGRRRRPRAARPPAGADSAPSAAAHRHWRRWCEKRSHSRISGETSLRQRDRNVRAAPRRRMSRDAASHAPD